MRGRFGQGKLSHFKKLTRVDPTKLSCVINATWYQQSGAISGLKDFLLLNVQPSRTSLEAIGSIVIGIRWNQSPMTQYALVLSFVMVHTFMLVPRSLMHLNKWMYHHQKHKCIIITESVVNLCLFFFFFLKGPPARGTGLYLNELKTCLYWQINN